MYSTVLVPLDGSRLAAEALPHAVSVARRFGASILLLHVLPAEDGSNVREHQASRSQLEAYLDGLKRSLQRCGVKVEWRIEAGETAETIGKVATSTPGPLLVLARAGRTAAQASGDKDSFGKVAEEVVALWDGPLLLIRPYA